MTAARLALSKSSEGCGCGYWVLQQWPRQSIIAACRRRYGRQHCWFLFSRSPFSRRSPASLITLADKHRDMRSILRDRILMNVEEIESSERRLMLLVPCRTRGGWRTRSIGRRPRSRSRRKNSAIDAAYRAWRRSDACCVVSSGSKRRQMKATTERAQRDG
jgi:hypothetical protein